MTFNGLNDAIKIAARSAGTPRFEVRDVAPNSFEDVQRVYLQTGKLVVWSGGTERTIYDDVQVNYIFRAWHDWTHIKIQAGFDLAGETATGMTQIAQVGDELGRIIKLEVIGQATHAIEFGTFVEDQKAWTINQLRSNAI